MAKSKSKRRDSPAPPLAAAVFAPVDQRSVLVQVGVVLGVAFAARLIHFFAMRDSLLFQALVSDSGRYDAWGQEIAAGNWLGNAVFYQTPLYPYLLGTIYTVAGHSVWAVRFVQALFGAVACVCLARAAARFFNERVGWVSGLLLALYPPAIFFDGILQKASLDLLFMTALLWVLAIVQTGPRWQQFLVAGLLLGGMTLNRENAAVLFPVLAVWLVWLARTWRSTGTSRGRGQTDPAVWSRVAVWGVSLAAGATLVLVPVGLRNYYVGGMFALTTSQMGPNFYIGNNPRATGGYETLRADRGDPRYEAEDARLLAEADLKRPLAPGEVSRYWMGRSWQYIQSDPAGWLRLMAWKWFLTWHAVEMIDAESIQTHELQSPLLGALGHVLHFGVICPLAALGVWFTRADWRRLWLLYATLAAFAAAVTLFYVFARYRYPLVPVAMMFAGAGLVGLWDRWRLPETRQARELAIGAALAGLVALCCNWPFPRQYNENAISYYNAGSTLLDGGRLDEAQTLLAEAAALEPTFGATFNNLGRIAQTRGDLNTALVQFQQAAKLEPDHGVYHYNLASVLLAQGQTKSAAECLRRAIALDPLLVPALIALAQLEQQAGRSDEALLLVHRAIAIEPNSPALRGEMVRVLIAEGHWNEAIRELRAALERAPSLALVNQLAWILATAPADNARSGTEALKLAESVCQATQRQAPEPLDTLAAAQAEQGEFALAGKTLAEALAKSRDAGMTRWLEERRQFYAQQKPWRSSAPQFPSASSTPAQQKTAP